MLKKSANGVMAAIAGSDYATPASVDAKLDKTGGSVGYLLPTVNQGGSLGSVEKQWANIYGSGGIFGSLRVRGILAVDSGSNSNGNWVKFYDGTMFAYKSTTYYADITRSAGSLYYGYGASWTFPVAFIGEPIVSITLNDSIMLSTNANGITSTNVSAVCIYSYKSASGYMVKYDMIAVGRWK